MLSKKQKQVFDFIESFIGRKGYAPSLEEIAKHFGLSAVSTVHYHVEQLKAKGLLTNRWNANRSLEIVHPLRGVCPVSHTYGPSLLVPLLGVIAAGQPIEAIEQEETIELPPSLVGRKNTYVLRVQGNSMIDEHIRDGDFVVIEKRDTANDGETVVALLNRNEATLKKFYREKKGMIRLQPANSQMAPIYCREEDVVIQGVVIAVLRKF